MWKTLPLERFVEHALKNQFAEEGESLWAKYVDLRAEVSGEILPWIQRNEPDLSDHGVDHIQNVITNVTQLLGLPRGHGGEAGWPMPAGFCVHELMLLLFGCLTHDLGNIMGREKHNLAIGKAASLAGGGWAQLVHGDRLIIERIGRAPDDDEPERLHAEAIEEPRSGPLGVLRDLQDLYLLASLTDVTWTVVQQCAQALVDEHLLGVVEDCQKETSVQLRRLITRMKQAAPQALIAAR